MALTKVKLGKFIELLNNKNVDSIFGVDDVRGVNNLKELMPTKADISSRDLSKFQIVAPDEFVFNHRTSRNGSKFSIALNNTQNSVICTEDYVVFRIKPECKNTISALWLYLFFNRPEFDRYVITNSWGSSTEFYNWEDLCNVVINLPPIEIQQKYVAIYEAMIANQQSYERGLEDLKLVCDAYIEDLRRNNCTEPVGKYMVRKNDKNIGQKISKVMGLSTQKQFREAQSRVNKNELSNYKIVLPNEFAFVPTTDTWKVLAFGLNTYEEPIVVSPIYEVFAVQNNLLEPRYLAMWLSRIEFDRYARYNSWGSARENFSFEEMCNVHIPIPNIDIQRSISDVFSLYKKRKDINEQLKTQIKNICPILIKGSLEEGK